MGAIRGYVAGPFSSSMEVEIPLPDEVAIALVKRADHHPGGMKGVWEEAFEAVMAGPFPIKYGERALQVVLTFAHGQTVAFPLKIRDTTGIANVELNDVTVEGVRVLVRPQEEAERTCRTAGHTVGNIKSVGPNVNSVGPLGPSAPGRAPQIRPRVHGMCAVCGDAVWFWDDVERTDVDVIIAEEAVRRVTKEPGLIEDDLSTVDRLRRRLEARRAEMDEALENLRVVRLTLASRIERELQA